uniref:Uncharacterized protein n=1 Tax=Plectus sambesii TaxID=2011161 RepID=A0A914WML3_9BILA
MPLVTIHEVEEEEDEEAEANVLNALVRSSKYKQSQCKHMERFYFLPHFFMILLLIAVLGAVIIAATMLGGLDKAPPDSVLLEKNYTDRLQTIIQTRRLLFSYRATRQRAKIADIIAKANK